ncbi:MAG: hypothetical protein ABSC06_18725 [Rhodopila sp.]|jgi:hypothetical protein
MKIKRVEHIAIAVDSMKQSLDFLDPFATGTVVIELAELAAGH